MEFILDLVGDSLPSHVFCLLILLVIALKDLKLHQNLKVRILYLVSFIMILMGWVKIYLGVAILILVEFALLEIFTEDIEKRSLFGMGYKVIDCMYKLFIENFEMLSLEEFFVWCISLEFFALIGPKTIMKRESIIVGYGLNQTKIRASLKKAYAAK